MPDLEKILPLILIALWYIFRGGKKKVKKQEPNRFEESQHEEAAPANRAPDQKKPNSLQDILEELMGEEKAKTTKTFEQPVNKPKPEPKKKPVAKPSYTTEADSLETLNAKFEKMEQKSKETRSFIKDYEESQEAEDSEHADFDLREAIIHQAILERPYKD